MLKSRITAALGVVALVAMMGAATLLDLTTQVKGVLPQANGGTGTSTVGTTGQVLTSNGTSASWQNSSGSGGSISLRTNGTVNGSQAVLNLAQGTGTTLADNGTGTVTVTATAAGQVASNNVAMPTSAIAASPGCSTAQNVTTAGATADSLTTATFRTNPIGVTGWGDHSVSLIIFQGSGQFTWKVCNNTAGSITPGAISLNFRTSL